jgi:hypothetical protein
LTQVNQQSLREKLVEDLGVEKDIDEYLPPARALQDWPAPAPSHAMVERLLGVNSRGPSRRRSFSFGWLLLRAQMQVMHRELWIATALVMAIGTLLTWHLPLNGVFIPLAWVAPLAAAVGVAMVYGIQADPAFEIELALPVSPRLLLLTRLVLVFSFDLGLGLIASLVLSTAQSGSSFFPLVVTWLAPMAFLSALSFFVTVLWCASEAGISLSLGLWTVLTVLRFQDVHLFPWLARLPELFMAQAYPGLLLSAVSLFAAALWLAGSEERWINSQK